MIGIVFIGCLSEAGPGQDMANRIEKLLAASPTLGVNSPKLVETRMVTFCIRADVKDFVIRVEGTANRGMFVSFFISHDSGGSLSNVIRNRDPLFQKGPDNIYPTYDDGTSGTGYQWSDGDSKDRAEQIFARVQAFVEQLKELQRRGLKKYLDGPESIDW